MIIRAGSINNELLGFINTHVVMICKSLLCLTTDFFLTKMIVGPKIPSSLRRDSVGADFQSVRKGRGCAPSFFARASSLPRRLYRPRPRIPRNRAWQRHASVKPSATRPTRTLTNPSRASTKKVRTPSFARIPSQHAPPKNARSTLTRPPEQEKLIQTLHTTDAAKTRLYTALLLPLPLLPTLLYLPRLTTSLPAASLSAAAIVSLLATAYILYYLPHTPETASSRRPEPPEAGWSARRHVVPLNGVLSAALAVREGLAGTGWREGLAGGGGYVPACKFAAAFSSSPSHPPFSAFCICGCVC